MWQRVCDRRARALPNPWPLSPLHPSLRHLCYAAEVPRRGRRIAEGMVGPLGVVVVHESTDCVLELCRRLVLRAPQTLRRITRPEALSNTLLSAQSRASSPVKSSPQELAATLWAARPTEPVAHDRIYGTDRAARCRVFLSANEVAHGNGFDPLYLITLVTR